MALDLYIFRVINAWAGRSESLDLLGIFAANYLWYLLVLAFVFLLIRERSWALRWHFFGLASLSVILSRGVLTEIVKFFYARPRPFSALGTHPLIAESMTGSFPSGHAAALFALAIAVFYYLNLNREQSRSKKKWYFWFFGGALVMSIGRIFVGIHWPSDILGGIIIAILSAYVAKNMLPAPKNQEIPNSKRQTANPRSQSRPEI